MVNSVWCGFSFEKTWRNTLETKKDKIGWFVMVTNETHRIQWNDINKTDSRALKCFIKITYS